MARARNIKPGLFKNEILGVADPLLTLLFESLWCLADKQGRLEDRPLRIKAETFPYRDNLDVNGYLTELQRLGFIQRYSVNGLALIQVINFKKHQTPHKTEKDSVLPGPESATIAAPDLPPESSLTPLNNGEKTEALPPDLLIPDSSNTDSGFTDSGLSDPLQKQPRSAVPSTTPPDERRIDDAKRIACRQAWDAYAGAYLGRYRTEPVRNAKVNRQIVEFVGRLGYSESPHVARFFVGHNSAYYVREMHAVGAMLKDAEKLRTEWATNSTMTQTKALQTDKTQTNLDAFAPLIAAQRAKEEAERNGTCQPAQ